MGAKFKRKGPTPNYSITPNPTYEDLYDNNLTTADIQSGTVGDITKHTIFITDYIMPPNPSYGAGNLIGAETAFYVNSADTGDGTNSAVLKSYYLKKEIGNNEGGKSSTTGTLINNEDIVQICAYHSEEYPYIHEDFSNSGRDGIIAAYGNYYISGSDEYLNKVDGYDYGLRFGGKNLTGYNKQNKTDHLKSFGQENDYLIGTGYKIHAARMMWWSDKQWKGLTGHWSEKYDPFDILSKRKRVNDQIKTLNEGTSSIVEKLNTQNSIFDMVKEDLAFSGLTSEGDVKLQTYASITIKGDNALTGGKSLHFDAVYPHRFNTSTQVYYPPRGGASATDGSENQQVSFISKSLPCPVHLYSQAPVIAGDGKQPVMPTIELDINIEELTPMLLRDQDSSYAEPAHDFRLTRSITITFGEERPSAYDNLHSYVKRFAPNAATAGTGAGTGLGTSAKSFFGLSLVNYNGRLAYYNLGNAGKSGSTYTDTTFGIDNSRGEVCFSPAPTYISSGQGEGFNNWFTLAFQTHPNDQGAYWTMFEKENGEVIGKTDPYTSGKITNIKNITATGAGIWANNIDDWPKWMTIWSNNYQSVLGKYNSEAKLYETGLRTAVLGSSATELPVMAIHSATNTYTGEVWASAGKFNASYLLLDRGDKIEIADDDGTNSSGMDGVITECDNAVDATTSAGTYTIESDSWAADQYVYHRGNTDPQIGQSNFDCRISFYIDAVRIKHFNMLHDNATPHRGGSNIVGNLNIPQTIKLPNTAWQDGSSAVTNVLEDRTQQPSYICLGFDSFADITDAGTLGIGETKLMHMNGFQTSNPTISGNIVTSHVSTTSNIRVGYTSSVENYGRQGAADSSTALGPPDTGNGASSVIDNDVGTPTYALRGLKVGDLDSSGREFSVEADGSGDDGVGNVDYFTQKGLMKFKVAYREEDSGDETSNGDVVAMGAPTFLVLDADNFPVGGYIKIEDEIMKVTGIDSGTNVVTVTRGIEGTDDQLHPDTTTISHVSWPEKRECIFASARILKGAANWLVVDSPEIFDCKDSEEYIIYKYNAAHAVNYPGGPTSPKILTVVEKKGDAIYFNKQTGIDWDNKDEYLISPYRHWLIIEILNISGAHGWQDDGDDTVYLPKKSYKNIVGISEKGTYGATFNESSYTDGKYLNKWNLEIYDLNDTDSVAKLTDYGFGEFDEEKGEGGYCGLIPISVNNDVSKYKYMDLNNLIIEEDIEGSDVVPILMTSSDPDDDVKFNIDTEIGTNPNHIVAIYEDEVPVIEDLKVAPNEDNAFNVDFTWEASDDDLWYGFLIIDDKTVHSQYTNAVLHYPMNESGAHGAKATAPIDLIQGMATSVDATSSTGPFYDVEGLAGNCLRNDATGIPEIAIGTVTAGATTGADPLASTGYAVTDEMTINFHFIHDSDADGTLAKAEYLLNSTQRFQLRIITDGTLEYLQYWDTDSYIKLTSTSPVAMDGDTPTNVMITFDANLINGNVKLFVNGKMEDSTGVAITADASSEQAGWYFQQEIEHNVNVIWVGNQNQNGTNEFLGRMEELVIYNKCLYPVIPSDGKYTFTKPVKELHDTSGSAQSKSYTARLFVKDYHNIRGNTIEEVGSSSPVSFRKAAFRLDNS